MSGKLKSLDEVLKREPQFDNNTLLDRFFKRFHKQIASQISDDSNQSIYAELGCVDNAEFASLCMNHLEELNKIVLQTGSIKKDGQYLLPISLHDMKDFDLLVNLIVVHGIYANLPKGFGIPLEQRKMGRFRDQDKRFIIAKEHIPNSNTLQHICFALYNIFISNPIKENVISELLLKGTGYTDLLTGLIALLFQQSSQHEIFSKMIDNLESFQSTYELLSLYSLLVHSTEMSDMRTYVLEKLSTLPIRRNDGVISVIEFIVGIREEEEINVEKLRRVNQLLVARPKTLKSTEYFSKLFDQIYDGMVNLNRPIMITCLNSLVTEFFFKNRRIVKDFLFKKIYRILYNEQLVDISSKELNDTINVVISLSKNTSLEVVQEFTSGGAQNFYLNLWIYAMYLKKNQRFQPGISPKDQNTGSYYRVIIGLIKTFIVLTSNYHALDDIVLQIVNFDHESWGYGIDLETQLPYVKLLDDNKVLEDLKVTPLNDEIKLQRIQEVFLDIDLAVNCFNELLKMLNEPDVIKDLFLSVMNRWVRATGNSMKKEDTLNENVQNSLLVLVDLKLLEKMNEHFKDDIIRKPQDVLLLVDELLDFCGEDAIDDKYSSIAGATQDSDDEDDETEDPAVNEESFLVQPESSNTFITLLKLLSAVLSSTKPEELIGSKTILESITNTLSRYDRNESCQSLKTNISKILARDFVLNTQEDGDKLKTQKFLLQKAMANLNDSSVPIRAHGLYELRSLIEQKSPLLETELVLNLHIKQLHEQDPFIYLNAIKGLVSLCQVQPEKSMEFLLDFYRNENRKHCLDDLLRVGEVLMNYIMDSGELFSGKSADALVGVCLEKVQQVETTDDRLRMSAMSLLSMCLRINAKGVRKHITDLLDCAFGILRLEMNDEDSSSSNQKNPKLMRRSAVHLIYDLIQSTGLSALPQQYSGSKLVSLINYAKENDRDYLTCEQIDALLALIRSDLKEQLQISDIPNEVVQSLKL